MVCCERCLAFRAYDADRAEACSLQARRGPDLAQEGGNGGFAVGARNRRHRFGLRAVKTGREKRQGLPGLGNLEDWHGKTGRIGIRAGQDRHRAALDSALRERHAVGLGAGQRREQHARPDAPAIFCKASNFLG